MSGTGDRTFDTVRARYEDWFGKERRPLPGRDVWDRSEHWETEPSGGEMSRMVPMMIALVIGLGLLGLAALAFATAAAWNGYARDGAFVGYLLVGLFLTIAGVGCIAATWNHNFRVVTRSSHH